MPQSNNSGRRATLDSHKERAAGRADVGKGGRATTGAGEKSRVKGAFGKDGHPNRRQGDRTGGGRLGLA
jgi:hypothetical protein